MTRRAGLTENFSSSATPPRVFSKAVKGKQDTQGTKKFYPYDSQQCCFKAKIKKQALKNLLY